MGFLLRAKITYVVAARHRRKVNFRLQSIQEGVEGAVEDGLALARLRGWRLEIGVSGVGKYGWPWKGVSCFRCCT
jgi:hypothetical protein